jgi:hypothetical protein
VCWGELDVEIAGELEQFALEGDFRLDQLDAFRPNRGRDHGRRQAG